MRVVRTNVIPLTKPEDLFYAIRELETRISAVNFNLAEGGGGSSGSLEIDGGSAGTVFTVDDVLDGGTA